jgi:hypothetical protein
MYEFHTVQEGTEIHPGQTANTGYSLTQTINPRGTNQLQLGMIGYGQWQATGKTGPALTLQQTRARYAVNALGFAANLAIPDRKLSLGLKFFKEFSNRSTSQGSTLHIFAAVAF